MLTVATAAARSDPSTTRAAGWSRVILRRPSARRSFTLTCLIAASRVSAGNPIPIDALYAADIEFHQLRRQRIHLRRREFAATPVARKTQAQVEIAPALRTNLRRQMDRQGPQRPSGDG